MNAGSAMEAFTIPGRRVQNVKPDIVVQTVKCARSALTDNTPPRDRQRAGSALDCDRVGTSSPFSGGFQGENEYKMGVKSLLCHSLLYSLIVSSSSKKKSPPGSFIARQQAAHPSSCHSTAS